MREKNNYSAVRLLRSRHLSTIRLRFVFDSDSRVEIQRSNLKSSHCIAGDATDGRTDGRGRGRQMQESSDKTFIQEHFGTRRTSHMLCCELQGIVVKNLPFRSLVRFEE